MTKEDYQRYLNSRHWREFRQSYWQRHEKKCSKCGRTKGRIMLHHLTYEDIGNEKDCQVQPLCFRCHAKRHPETFSQFSFSY